MRTTAIIVVTVLGPIALGCSAGQNRPTIAPTSGKIIYKGQPVEGAIVTFIAPNSPRTAVGKTDADGEFKLTTIDTNDGAIVGENVVTVFKPPAAPPAGQAMPKTSEEYVQFAEKSGSTKPPSVAGGSADLPAKYADAGKSEIRRTVVQGETNHFNIELTD